MCGGMTATGEYSRSTGQLAGNTSIQAELQCVQAFKLFLKFAQAIQAKNKSDEHKSDIFTPFCQRTSNENQR